MGPYHGRRGLTSVMGNGQDDLGERSAERRHRHRSKQKRKNKSRKMAKLLDNLLWFAVGLAVGLPLLALTLYLISRY